MKLLFITKYSIYVECVIGFSYGLDCLVCSVIYDVVLSVL